MRIRILTVCLTAALLFGLVPSSISQNRDPFAEMQRRAEEIYFQQRVDSFVEETFEFYEISGELISFRVHPNMTPDEMDLMDQKAEDLEDKVDDLISFVRFIFPRVRGNTDDLWVILEPVDENSTLESRLTLILSLVNGIDPKLQHFVEVPDGREPAFG